MEFLLQHLRKIDECRCCFSRDLRKGVLFILYLWTVLLSLLVIVLLCQLSEIDDDYYVDRSAYLYIVKKITFLAILLVVLLFQVLPALLALYGVYKEKPSFLEPYVFTKVVEILFCLLFLILLIVSFFIVTANRTNLVKEFDEIRQIHEEAQSARNWPSRKLLQFYNNYEQTGYYGNYLLRVESTVAPPTSLSIPTTSRYDNFYATPTTTRTVHSEVYYPKWSNVGDWKPIILCCILALVGYTIVIYYSASLVYNYYLKAAKQAKQRGISTAGYAPVIVSVENRGLPYSASLNTSAFAVPMGNPPPFNVPSAPVEGHQPPLNPMYPSEMPKSRHQTYADSEPSAKKNSIYKEEVTIKD